MNLQILRPIFGLTTGMLLCAGIASFAGENPVHVLQVIYNSAFGSMYDFGLTLFYVTSLIFTGLSVCIAFHAGLFNIGAEGQLTLASLAAAVFALYFPQIPFPFSILSTIIVSIVAGGLWALVAGWLKATRGSHEVIITMMMNFVAAGVASYVVVSPFKNMESQNPETASIPAHFMFSQFDFVQKYFGESPVNLSLLFAILLAVFVWFFLYKTTFGFQLRSVGLNETASEIAGIDKTFYKMLSMFLAGSFAGFVALNEILGSAGKFRLGFSPEFGFVGIAVALLARNNPIVIIFSAFLFGALQKGAADLDFDTQYITRDFAKILQSVIILSVVSFNYIPLKFLEKREKRNGN